MYLNKKRQIILILVNYNNGKIYKLECFKTGLIYVGSTTKDYLCQRLSQHKRHYRAYQQGKRTYITSFAILENDNYTIELLESVNCNTKDELLAREGYYIRTLECVNKYIVGRTHKEYHQDHKEKRNADSRQYHHEHKDEIAEKRKKPFTCECGSVVQHSIAKRHLQSNKHKKFIDNKNVF